MDRLRVANVYIDGLNLYYGAPKDSSYKWLDVSRFATSLLKSDVEVRRVRYFTARLKVHQDPDAPLRQATYLRALDTLAGVSIHHGLFLRHAVSLPRVSGNGTVEVWRSEEKGSDVNLATYLILDAVEEKPDVALVVTNDTDLIVPIREVRSRFGIAVGVSAPALTRGRRPNRELREAASFTTPIRNKSLRENQLPDPVVSSDGREIGKPTTW